MTFMIFAVCAITGSVIAKPIIALKRAMIG